MKDFKKEITAYALKNAIEHGKADVGKILPKLFQHGLEKKDIGKIMHSVQEIVKEINSRSDKVRKMEYGKYKQYVKEREEKEKTLPDLVKGKGKPKFRIAPFPSGALHIGNARTFLLNAIYAERNQGKVVLVMDDTIGSEKKPIAKEAYKLIEDAVKWLKIDYDKKIVYKSDRLKIYYDYAEKLIKKDKAYVCHCSSEELRQNRLDGRECSCRVFPKEIQMKRWKEMFKANEGEATLRIKTDMQHKNPAFRDRVLFKISDREHVRVKKKYRVWPTLEMSWAIDDHLLGITHIIRGNDLMIESDMERYIWDIFKWKHPEIIHVGLVNVDFGDVKISKSKAQEEVKSGKFIGWEDPRTWSIQSLERRGITSEAFREFVKDMGVNKQDITIPIETLYSINRSLIDGDADRYFFVKDRKKITLKNKPKMSEIEIPVHPEKNKMKKIKVSKELFVSGDDFERLKGKEVRLLHLFNVKLNENAEVTSIENKNIPKIQWISDFVFARVLMPSGNWVEGLVEDNAKKLKVGEEIQFERFGFVRFDGRKKGIHEFWFSHK